MQQIKIIPAPKQATFGKATSFCGVRLCCEVPTITQEKLAGICVADGMPLGVEYCQMPSQSYILEISENCAKIFCYDQVSLHYAVLTLVQIANQCKYLPQCKVSDSPDFETRGLMIDISRNKVPTLETLFEVVREMSDLKLNMLQLYVEGRSFYYDDKSQCYENPQDFLTAQDVAKLQHFCAEHYIRLVPNGNSLGHMSYWLSREEYKHLAYSQEGFLWWENGLHSPAGTLDPKNPQSKQFVYGLFDKILQPYENPQLLNIGGDEPFEFSFGNKKLENEGEVYVDFMADIVENMRQRGLTCMMWGDIVQKHPECIDKLKDVIFLEWAYTAGNFSEEKCKNYNKYNARYYVCPSCSLHSSFSGKTDNMLQNIQEAARAGKNNGAEGFLNTNWGDGGSQQFAVSEFYAYAMGAAVCWNVDAFDASEVEQWLDREIYHCKLAKLLGDLGRYCRFQADYCGGIPKLFSALYIRQTDGINFDKNYSDPTGFFYRDELLTFDELQKTQQYVETLSHSLPKGKSLFLQETRALFDVLNLAIKHSYLCWGLKNINYTSDQVLEVLQLTKSYNKTFKKLWFKRNKRSDYDLASYRLNSLVEKYKYILKNHRD